MKVLIFGATGMVGRGLLRECLLDPEIERVATIGRSPTGVHNPKLHEIVHSDLSQYQSIESELSGWVACFFCLGTPSAGKSEAEYARITYGFTLAAAHTLCRLNPQMTFIYVSAMGADSSEKGRMMWARVRGKTENALLKLPFKAVYIFRPGLIRPLHGIHSKTRLYRLFYQLSAPVLPLLRAVYPQGISTTERLGQAMIRAAKTGAHAPILTTADFEKILA